MTWGVATLEFVGALVLLLVGYYTLPKRMQWPLLLLASVLYYAGAGMYAGAGAWVYITVSWLSSYGVARRIASMHQRHKAAIAALQLPRDERKQQNTKAKAQRRRWLVAGLVLNFGMLAGVKLAGLPWVTAWGQAQGLQFLMPLGISFYVFRLTSYTIDVYWQKAVAEPNPCKLLLFGLFFPQVPQGPISRWGNVQGDLFAPHPLQWAQLWAGVQRITLGYFKKLVLADRLLVPVRELTQIPGQNQGGFALAAMGLYAAQLYCDFTGGMDIAIGIAACFGIRLEENFLSPFRSQSIVEYWRRWHITMGTWFRDYIFYPLSVSKPLRRATEWLKQSKYQGLARRFSVYSATLVTWLATGLWHGFAWNFVVWGLVNGVVLLLSQELQPLYNRFHARCPWSQRKGYAAWQVLRTFWLMAFIRSFDIYANVPLTFARIGSIFAKPQLAAFVQSLGAGSPWMGLGATEWLVLAVGLGLLLLPGLRRGENGLPLRQTKPGAAPWGSAVAWSLLVLAILVFGLYGLGYNQADFIYTRF